MAGYSELVGKFPSLFIAGVVLLTSGAGISIYFAADLPDFEDPVEGFVARGTPIIGKYLANYLLDDPRYELSEIPPFNVPLISQNIVKPLSQPNIKQEQTRDNDLSRPGMNLHYIPGHGNQRISSHEKEDIFLQNIKGNIDQSFTVIADKPEPSPQYTMEMTEFPETTTQLIEFSESPETSTETPQECVNSSILDLNHFHIIFESSSKANSLFTTEALKEICRFEDEVVRTSQYIIDARCRGPSVASLVAKMQDTDCALLTDEHVDDALTTLKQCSVYYNSMNISAIPLKCLEGGLAFYIYYALVDKGFLDKTGNEFLVFSALGVKIQPGKRYEFYQEKLEKISFEYDLVNVAGIDSSVKVDVFGNYMIKDSLYFVLAMAIIMILLLLYLRSVVVTLAAFLNVVCSFILAYFIYTIVFRFPYFPFINILSALVLIAIGADNVFLFHDMWQQVKMESPHDSVASWVNGMMSHAAVSVFVTSFTTASAFYANIISDVTDIKCFGVFVGTAILCNFALMVTWVPAIFVYIDWCQEQCCSKSPLTCCSCYETIIKYTKKACDLIFVKGLPFLINKLWFIWIILFTLVGIGGVVVVFGIPKLKLPSSGNFQLLQKDNPIERYDETLKYRFRISNYLLSRATNGFMISWVWGVKGRDTGSAIDPDDRGHLIFEKDFNISSKQAQVWMLDFCEDLKGQDFIKDAYRNRKCIHQVFNTVMNDSCVGTDLYPCCEQGLPPYDPDTFQTCFTVISRWLSFNDVNAWNRLIGKALFDKDNRIKAFRMELESTFDITPSFTETKKNYGIAKDHMNLWLEKAPNGVDRGWFTGNTKFMFYDLQNSLFEGTLSAFGVALAFSITVMFLMTLNVLITIYAIITIAMTIFVTIGILVLIGWELNIVESIIICVAVGLSIDFTIHYGVAYRMSPHHHRKSRVDESFKRVGASVAMAALTTFLAGVAVMPTKVLAYSQFGTFLMIIMAISWSYSTFFFQSLCRIIGPNGDSTQLSCTFKKDDEYQVSDKQSQQTDSTYDNASLNYIAQNIQDIYKRYDTIKINDDPEISEMGATHFNWNHGGKINKGYVTDSDISDKSRRITPVEDDRKPEQYEENLNIDTNHGKCQMRQYHENCENPNLKVLHSNSGGENNLSHRPALLPECDKNEQFRATLV